MRERRFFPPLLKVSKEKSFVSIVCSLALYPAANSHEDLTHFHAQEIQLDNFRSILFVKFSPFLHFTRFTLKSSIANAEYLKLEKLWWILTNNFPLFRTLKRKSLQEVLIHHSKLDAEENFAITQRDFELRKGELRRRKKHKLMKVMAENKLENRIYPSVYQLFTSPSRYWKDLPSICHFTPKWARIKKRARGVVQYTNILSYEWFCCTEHSLLVLFAAQ